MNGFLVSQQARQLYGIDDATINRLGSLYLNHPGDAYQLFSQFQQVVPRGDALHLLCANALCNTWRYLTYLFHQKSSVNLLSQREQLLANLGQENYASLQNIIAREFPQGQVKNIYNEKNKYFFSSEEEQLVEPLILWLANENPAMGFVKPMFDDSHLRRDFGLTFFVQVLSKNVNADGLFTGYSLLDVLLEPIRKAPHSLLEQIDFLLERWGGLLGDLALELLRVKDLIAEAHKFHGVGPGPVEAGKIDYDNLSENFSHDRDWMTNLVLLAKNVYVWISQLSKQYSYAINRLDEIPDEELQELAGRGITGVWLIGLWQRSRASKTIKHWCGSYDAEASAYSLEAYRVADDLGGEAAFYHLKERMARFGLRVGCDMVPNHMGIDSDWIYQHPDWFIATEQPPFASYHFSGESLSSRTEVGIYLEDHYFDKSDAAVVFKYVNHRDGVVRYIYHGNDGTSMPWNDTAQLNYLLPQVRQAVADVIIKVAHLCSIIRFDAAMTLTKKHFQRLWFPQPGSGGDIASRSWFGLTQEEFDKLMPTEFWKDVVDRIAAEKSDTLLLAEAFWFTEEFFVRTLGMHRVYNSAFMHMLRDEDNAKYRSMIKETIAFNSEILKRYTNFMNNPDEKTAIEQFGNGDKYFGVFTVMITLPGLPMIGHGQFEGYHEKYGMEFRDAKWNEKADKNLVQRHLREITPLLKKRYLFADVGNFRFFNFFEKGGVNENVYAYTNRVGDEIALVFYNNNFQQAAGQIFTSEPYRRGNAEATQTMLITQVLGISHLEDGFLLFQNQKTALYHLLPVAKIKENGFFDSLDGYQAKVYSNFSILPDQHKYWDVYFQFQNNGFYGIEQAVSSLVFYAFEKTMRKIETFNPLQFLHRQTQFGIHKNVIRDFKKEIMAHNKQVQSIYENFISNNEVAEEVIVEQICSNFETLCHVLLEKNSVTENVLLHLIDSCDKNVVFYLIILTTTDWPKLLSEFFKPHLENIIKTDIDINLSVPAMFFFLEFMSGFRNFPQKNEHNVVSFLNHVFNDTVLRKILEKMTGKHSYEGISYFNKERLQNVVNHFTLISLLLVLCDVFPKTSFDEQSLQKLISDNDALMQLAENSGYQWHNFMLSVQKSAPPSADPQQD